MEQIRIVKEQRAESEKQLIASEGENFDKTKIKPRYMVWENVCLSGTTLVTTSSGYKYIKDVAVGELVRTHDGTYHKVLQTYKTEMQPTIKVKFQGGTVECTPNHPFLTEDLTYKPMGEFKVGDRVGFKVDEPGTMTISMPIAYAFGRWLADGSIAIRNDRRTKHRIFISTGYKKYESLKAELSKLPWQINEQKMDWAINFTFSSDEFGRLTDSAGYGARNKQVPEWVFNLVAEERDEVLRGYLDGDGYQRVRSENHTECSFATSSEKLAHGIARLVRAVYHVGVSLSCKEGKGTTIIDGREVNAHDSWYCSFSIPNKCEYNLQGVAGASKYSNGYVWCRIREISEGELQDVYNLSVEDNNTYEANSVVCHNCGAFSSGEPGGSDFQAVLEEICKIVKHDCPVVPIPKEGWPASGNLDGVGDDGTPFSICWRTHDAQYFGVPQRRRRIALVADFRGTSAPQILFECEGMSGNSQPSKQEGQRTSEDTSRCVGETSENSTRRSDGQRVNEIAATVSSGSEDSGNVTQSVLQHQSSDATVYGISAYDSNSMKSNNPHSGIYEADSARTLDLNGANPACNQGGMAVVQPTAESMVFTQNEREEVRDLNDVAGSISAESGTHQQNFVMQSTEPICVGNEQLAQARLSDKVGMHDQQAVIQFMSEPSKETDGNCLNSWDVQSKHIQPENGIAESLYAGESSYGGGESYVLQNQESGCLNSWDCQSKRVFDPNSVSGTLNSGTSEGKNIVPSVLQNQEPVLLESNQNHATVQTDGVSTTLPASMGEGGGYVPMVCIEGNGSRESHRGNGYAETETMYTLNTVEQHAVAYGVTAKGNGDAFINPNTHTALSTGGGEPGQGYPCVLETKSQATVQSTYQKTTGALMASGYNKLGTQEAANDMFVVNPVQSMELFHCTSEEELAAPLKARDYKDPQVVAFEPGAASRVGGHVYTDGKAGTLRAEMGDNQQAICQGFDSYNMNVTGDVAKTLQAEAGGAGVNEGCVVQSTVYSIDQGAGKSGCNFDVNRAPTLTTTHGGEPVVLNDQGGQQMDVTQGATGTLRAEAHGHEPIVFDPSRRHDCEPFGDVCETVQAAYGTGGNNVPFVLNPEQQSTEDSSVVFENHSQDTRYNELGEVCQTVSATWGMGGNNQPLEVKPQQAIVRRLTPLECERLQGFPDYWTHIGDWVDSKSKKHKDSDSPKYKALGNSIALPFWYWMAGRMVAQLKKSGVEHPTMASLFDGIAGFPYVYIRYGCMPLWTSEIEEFPIAVCKRHFGDEDTGEVGDIEEYLKLPLNWVTSSSQATPSDHSPIAFDRAAFNQDANAKYDFSIEEDKAQTIVSRGPGGVCQSE